MRLIGINNRVPLTIKTERSGNFHLLLIPLPQNFQHHIALPTDYFSNITFDLPFAGTYTAGEPITVSGKVSNTSSKRFLFNFRPHDNRREVRLHADIPFIPAHTGEYTLTIFGGSPGGTLPELGSFTPFIVSPQ